MIRFYELIEGKTELEILKDKLMTHHFNQNLNSGAYHVAIFILFYF